MLVFSQYSMKCAMRKTFPNASEDAPTIWGRRGNIEQRQLVGLITRRSVVQIHLLQLSLRRK